MPSYKLSVDSAIPYSDKHHMMQVQRVLASEIWLLWTLVRERIQNPVIMLVRSASRATLMKPGPAFYLVGLGFLL